jgi:ATP-dependent RNA helicase DeaD
MWLERDRTKREVEIVEKLVGEGYDLIKVAAAALKIVRAEEKQRPIAQISDVRNNAGKRAFREYKRKSLKKKNGGKYTSRGKDSHEAGMVRLSMRRGRMHGIRPNDVVGTISAHAKIPGYTIGKILIRDQYTLVDIPEKFVDKVLAKTGDYRFRDQNDIAIELPS